MLSDAEVGASIAVKDLEAAKGWYGKTLGLTPVREAPDGIYYQCGSGTQFFIYPSTFAGTAQNTVAGFRVKDLERENSTLKRLLADAELEKAALKEIARGNF